MIRTDAKRRADKRYAARNREKLAAYQADYRKTHKKEARQYARSYYRSNPEKWEAGREKRLIKLYGITREQYDQMSDQQGGVCAICKQPETQTHHSTGRIYLLAVDHDHGKQLGEEGYVRGLLCHRCNQLLGAIELMPGLYEAIGAYLGRDAH